MQNNKSGHIKHEDIDMDPHDRAVRRSAGRRSRGQNRSRSSGAPLWLICILIFIGVVGFFLIRLSSKMKSVENAEVDLSTPVPQATEEPAPEAAPVSDPEVPSDRGGRPTRKRAAPTFCSPRSLSPRRRPRQASMSTAS